VPFCKTANLISDSQSTYICEMDPITISIIISGVMAGIIAITTGRQIIKDMHANRFTSFGYRTERIRPQDPSYNHLLDIIADEATIKMSYNTTRINDVRYSSNVVLCKVKNTPLTVRCRIGLQANGEIYLIVWDPPSINRKYGMAYYLKMLEDYANDGLFPLQAVSVSKM
jgi:hypothetical protein